MIDFTRIDTDPPETKPIDPIEIFQSLTVTEPGLNDLWLAQGDALREWHKKRDSNDVAIVLNTGAGKTLAGLLIAQSLVNKTRGKVLYACSSIQLVKQTAEKAEGYGMDVSTYFRGSFSNESLFTRCEAPCITTYQALFNGKSIFFDQEIKAVIFDDAHTAEHLLRDSFSVQIDRSRHPASVFDEILELFEDYFVSIGKPVTYQDIADNSGKSVSLLVHPFEMLKQHEELVDILLNAGVRDHDDTKFSWEHIKDHVDKCCVLISPSQITITPPFVPVTTLSYFSRSVHRVYLSATLVAEDAFVRTFGKVPKIVAPSTTAGECERLILHTSHIDNSSEGIEIVEDVIRDRKTLILVPTYARANEWSDLVEEPPRDQVADHVAAFRDTTDSLPLLLVSRYDGVDLPGDTCRLLVIDDLPAGVGQLERYLWESLGMRSSLRSTIASRIIQSFGRISRGMSDHGVVIITGKGLQEWLFNPNNLISLPVFLQKQIKLGDRVSKQFSHEGDIQEAIDGCLGRNKKWLNTYNKFMQRDQANTDESAPPAISLALAKAEVSYAVNVWRGNFQEAAQALSTTLDQAYSLSSGTGAWHALWLGSTQQRLGRLHVALDLYAKAHAQQHNIPPIRNETLNLQNEKYRPQIEEIARQFRTPPDGRIAKPRNLRADLKHLDGSGTPSQIEEALRCLGQYLGLDSTRPDKELRTGPDVLWLLEGGQAICMEAKTDKEETSEYNKKNVGQMYDHIGWVKKVHENVSVIPLFVGPTVNASESSNPNPDFRVCTLESFKGCTTNPAILEAPSNPSLR